MRVCVLSDGYPPWERGGAQKIAAQVAEGYARRGHDIEVVTTVPDRDDVGSGYRHGVTVHRLYAPRRRWLLPYLTVHNPLVAARTARLVDQVDPDVVHAHNVHYLSNASLRRAADRAPVVKTFHDAGTVSYGELTGFLDDVPPGATSVPAPAYRVSPLRQLREEGARYFPPRNHLNRRTLDRHVDVGVAVSHELRRALRANGVPCDRTVHNGVDTTPFDEAEGEGPAFRREHGLGDAPFVLFGGRTGYNKGGAHLAAAFGRVARATDGPVWLVVTGDDGYASRMCEVAGDAGDRIATTGWLPRRSFRRALRAATVVATPSAHLDPFPTVNLEAFASETPVVTTRFGGASELVEHGEDGLVVDPRDVDALAGALEALLDPDRAATYGTVGRRKVEREFTVEGQVDAYLDVLAAVADREYRRRS